MSTTVTQVAAGSATSVAPQPGRWSVALRCIAAGVLIAAAVPPWGWWPLAFVGVAVLDRLLADTTPKQRFRRTWLTTAAWLFPAMLWMFDLTPPGYLVAAALYAAYFGLAAALTPDDPVGRRIVLPGAIALAELARWYWPFGGVPLANIALGQVDSPLAITARLFGPAFIVMLVVIVGQALSAAIDGDRKQAGIGIGLVALAIGAGWAHPRATIETTADVAVVQGGGPVRTRASSDQQPVVLARHVEATRQLDEQVDLVLWPENVVNPGRFLTLEEATETVTDVAIATNATLLPGWFYPLDDRPNTVNYHTAVTSDGVEVDRYDKVQIVPFGEYVPLRGLIEFFSSEIPSRDVLRGTEPPVLDTPIGPVGVAISWEAYFDHRSRDAVDSGAQLLTNPTNGSSYWLTQVHTQQVASNQLRAIENDRWLLMAAPTGLSAVIDPNGNVVQRTDIGERAVMVDTVEMRSGRTLASRVGFWPVAIVSLVALAWSTRRAGASIWSIVHREAPKVEPDPRTSEAT